MQRFHRWLRLSVRRQLLVPMIAGGSAVALLSVAAIQVQARGRLVTALEQRALLVGNLVNYAAESAEQLSALQRFVTQAGAEPDVIEITVAAGTPAKVLASTRSAYAGKLLTELPGEEVGDDLAKAITTNAHHSHFNNTLHLFDYSMPLLLSQTAITDGSLAAGAVMIHLDTRPMQAESLVSMVQLVAAVVTSFGLMAFIAYRLLRRVVLAPLAAVEAAVTAHDEADDELWRPAETDNELGALARLLRESILARDSSEAAMRLTERMASVGTLAGGIAHEINTPLQFVSDGVHFLREASEEVIVAIAHVHAETQTVTAASTPDELRRVVATIDRLVDEVDVDYLAERVPAAATRSTDGVERVQSIVQSLKACAGDTPREMQPDDINRAVQNALTVVGDECRRAGQLTSTLGALPPVTCHVGDIFRAVTELLQNAADAVSDAAQTSGVPGTIDVRTWRAADDVVISVTDSGPGIPADVAPRIFDPFFTTKAVGRGDGQGLATTWTAVTERHNGRIWFEPAPGGGTTFFVRLPIGGRSSAASLEIAA